MAVLIMLPAVGADAGEWKAKLRALGISRKRGGRPAAPSDRRRLETGREGEELAARHLESMGLAILARNVRFPDGEIDVVAEEGPVVVFVEVRRRTAAGHGTAADSVTVRKRDRIVRAARRFLARRRRLAGRDVRFDVVTVDGDPPVVAWIRGAFDAV
jgi:putative endonuclease